jgi:hypothetical protein
LSGSAGATVGTSGEVFEPRANEEVDDVPIKGVAMGVVDG